jgi:hypothetical protein
MTNHHNNGHNHTPGHSTPATPRLSTAELFEMASLDALGLLDEQERRAFEEGFAAAAPSVKAQLRAAQSRVAEIDAFLPRVSPRAGLRDRVLAAVQAAIDAAIPSRNPVAKVHGAGREAPLLPSRGVSAIWRAVAIGCAAAVVVVSVVTVQMYRQVQEQDRAFASGEMAQTFIRSFGAQFEPSLYSPKTRFVQFDVASKMGAAARAQMGALLMMDPEAKTAQFFCRDLPELEGHYALVLLDEKGSIVRQVSALRASGGRIVAQNIAGLDFKSGMSFALTSAPARPDQLGEPLLRSNNL